MVITCLSRRKCLAFISGVDLETEPVFNRRVTSATPWTRSWFILEICYQVKLMPSFLVMRVIFFNFLNRIYLLLSRYHNSICISEVNPGLLRCELQEIPISLDTTTGRHLRTCIPKKKRRELSVNRIRIQLNERCT